MGERDGLFVQSRAPPQGCLDTTFYFVPVPEVTHSRGAWCSLQLRLLLLLGLLLLDLLENDDWWCPEGHGLAPEVGLAAILVEIPIFNRHGLLAPDNRSNGHKERKHGCRREHGLCECVHVPTRSWSISHDGESTKDKANAESYGTAHHGSNLGTFEF